MLRGRNIKTRLLNYKDEIWDRRLGIFTFGCESSSVPDGRYYDTPPYSILDKVFSYWGPSQQDVLVDIGAGLGRPIIYCASRYGLREAVGVEANEILVKKARENIRRAGVQGVSMWNGLAQQYSYSSASLVYLYNPFGIDTMRAVVSVLEKLPQSIRLAYLNPIEERAFDESTSFVRVNELSHSEAYELNTGAYKPIEIPAVSFWEKPSPPAV